MRVTRLAMLACVAALVVVTAAPASAVGPQGAGPGGALGGPLGIGAGSRAGYFAVLCAFSHRNRDDMIVFPGQPGRSHDHTYFGNTSTDASSTLNSLRAAGSTCLMRGDQAAYWVPTLMVDGKAVQPLGAIVYYVRRTSDAVQPFPPGLRMIAGDATARTAQSSEVTSWRCAYFGGAGSSVPNCRLPILQLRVRFPDCWDGVHLDAADHKGHMAYSTGGTCPSSHPVAVPGIQLVVQYTVAGGSGTELSSGGQFSGHADFVNAWDQQALTQLVDRFLNHSRQPQQTFV